MPYHTLNRPICLYILYVYGHGHSICTEIPERPESMWYDCLCVPFSSFTSLADIQCVIWNVNKVIMAKKQFYFRMRIKRIHCVVETYKCILIISIVLDNLFQQHFKTDCILRNEIEIKQHLCWSRSRK